MYRVVSRLLTSFLCLVALSVVVAPTAMGRTLVTIDGYEYSDQDYRDWWTYWQEPGMKPYDSPQEFIDFNLLADQGWQMEYQLDPGYQRKIGIYLKVRSLGALKYEEVDAKIKISEQDIRDYFEKKYSPIWSIQVLSYDEEAKATAVAEKLRVFNGQSAGHLIFADLAGVKAEDGGPLSYEEVQIKPLTMEKMAGGDQWLEAVSAIKKGFVGGPLFLEGVNRYAVIRMKDITFPDEDSFQRLHRAITRTLAKEQEQELTASLMKKIMEKYHVRIHEDIIADLSLKEDYPEDVMKRVAVEMDGSALTVAYLLSNAKRQEAMRVGLTDQELMRIIVNSFVSNGVMDAEALDRHYEEQEPLKSSYEFYKKNSLIQYLNAGIRQRVKVEEAEIKDYYDANLARFTEPGKISYVLIEEQVSLLEEISAALVQGADFFDLLNERSFDSTIKTAEIGNIEPEVAEQLVKLKKGAVSPPFSFRGSFALVRLIDHVEPEVVPYAKVRPSVKKDLLEAKYLAAKAAYLERARLMAEVEVNQRVWNKLKKEYGNDKDN